MHELVVPYNGPGSAAVPVDEQIVHERLCLSFTWAWAARVCEAMRMTGRCREALTDLVHEEGAVRLLGAGAGRVGGRGVVALEERVVAAGLEWLDQLQAPEVTCVKPLIAACPRRCVTAQRRKTLTVYSISHRRGPTRGVAMGCWPGGRQRTFRTK